MKKILVTGIDGYIGTILGQELIHAGFDITGFDTGYYRSGWLYNGVKKLPQTITKDIRNLTLEDLQGYTDVIHLAELSNDPIGQNNPEVTYAINHRGTVHLAKLAKKAGVNRFIYYSSCSVYGASENISTETSPINPLTAYAKCKVLNEIELSKLATDNFSPVFFRNATVYGASPRMRFDIAINNLTGIAWTTKKIVLESDGSAWRPFIHVNDLAHATICALNATQETIHNQIFNVGPKNANYEIKTIAEEIKKISKDCEIIINNSLTDKRNYRVSFEKIAKNLPEFNPKFDLQKGVSELFKTFKNISLTHEEFTSAPYTRLKQLKHLKETNQIDNNFFWL